MTNLLFMFIAPFFATFEIAQNIFGYRAKELKEWNKVVYDDIAVYRKLRGLSPMK